MKQLVLWIALAATGVAGIAALGMIVLGYHIGDGSAATVISDLQTLALIVVTAVAGILQHYMGAASSNGGSDGSSSSSSSPVAVSPAPTPAPVSAPVSDAGGA